MTEAVIKPILNGRVEITSIAELAGAYAAATGVDADTLQMFAEHVIRHVKWDFTKAADRGIQQAADILIDPNHYESVRQRRAREKVRAKERTEEAEVEKLVRSADPVTRLRSLRREHKLFSELAKRYETDIAVLRREWGDVIPPEAWEES